MNQYEKLIKKLDAFIRKFYLNQLLRGSLLFLICGTGVILLLSLGEYFFYLPSWLKISLLIILGLTSLLALIFWIIRPLLNRQRIGKIISREQAALIVGQFFPEIQDKLLNILQLKGHSHEGESTELAMAEIERKSSRLSVIPILKAINLKGNKRYLNWLVPLILVIAGIAFIRPQVLRDAAFRLSKPGENFYPPPPFTFQIENKALQTPLNENFNLRLKVNGEKLPDQVTIIANGQKFDMATNQKNQFSYTFNQVSKNIKFNFQAAGFRSEDYELKILEAPRLEKLTVNADHPAYTGLKDTILEGYGNITVPVGTHLKWQFITQNTDTLCLAFPLKKAIILAGRPVSNQWDYQIRIMQDTSFQVFLSNKALPRFDTLGFSIKSIPDNPPQITAVQNKDSISGRQVLITGDATDDYGLTRLIFRYKINDKNNKLIADSSLAITHPASMRHINYHHYFDINTLNLKPGQRVTYFIEAWDNDAVHGSKKTISEVYTYHQADNKQLEKDIEENNEAINRQLSNSANASENINESINKFKNNMLQSEGMSWEQQHQLKSLENHQTELQKKIDALKKRFQMQERQSKEKNYSENIRKKQEALQKQLDKIQNKDLAELMKKMQQMQKQKDKGSLFQELQQWQQQNKLFQMDMERIKELMKQLSLQMKLEDLAKKAENLAKEQSDLAKKTEPQKQRSSELSKKQKDLKSQLDSLMNKDLKEAEKMNQDLEKPKDLNSAKKEGEQADKNMQNSENSMQQGEMQNAGKQQSKASESLSKMAASLSKMAGGMDMEMLDINIHAVRQLLANLLRFSFAQEDLIKEERSTPMDVKTLKQHLEKQQTLKQNAEMIKDSLFALSKKIYQLAPGINKETSELTGHLEQSLDQLDKRRLYQAGISQQYAMTNANNLALMLDETLRNLMQMQAQGQKGKSGTPSSPGMSQSKGQGKGPGQLMKDIITGQKQLGDGMGKIPQQGNKGNQGNQGKSKENGGQSEEEAEQLVKLSQQQAALRQMMQDLSSMLNSQGNGQNAALIKEIQKAMDKNEVDFVNRHLSSELIERQQKIMTRLLKAQDAIREQERDNKRVAETGKDKQPPIPPELKDILETRNAFLESYQTIPATLKPFYKQMTEKYQKEIEGK